MTRHLGASLQPYLALIVATNAHEFVNLFLLLDKIEILGNLGMLHYEKLETEKAVKNLESAIQQARILYHGKPHVIIAEILRIQARGLTKEGKLIESISCYQEGKKVMDQILGPNHAHAITLSFLGEMGENYFKLNDFPKAIQCFKDAYNMSSNIYGENSTCGKMESICSYIAGSAEEMGMFSLAKEYYSKAFKICLTKNTRPRVYYTHDYTLYLLKFLYRLSVVCTALGQHNEALKNLEEARKMANDAGLKHWIVVELLVQLIRKYAHMGYIIKSISCYVEAGKMAKSLPKDTGLTQSTLYMLKLMNI